MKYFKLALISIVVFALLIFGLTFWIPSTVRVSRAIDISASPEMIVNRLGDQKDWSKWNEMVVEEMKITRIQKSAGEISSEWTYHGRTLKSGFVVEGGQGGSVVQWYFDFHNGWYPWEKLASITYDKQFGPPMERSLNNLKKLIGETP